MNEQLQRAFFEDLARIEDYAAASAKEAVAGDAPTWLERPESFDRLRSLLVADEDVDAFVSAVKELVSVAIHSTLVSIDGGSASAEIGRVYLVDEHGESIGDGLHEIYGDHLFETGRVEE